MPRKTEIDMRYPKPLYRDHAGNALDGPGGEIMENVIASLRSKLARIEEAKSLDEVKAILAEK